jgi:hypothetical protein
MVQQVTAIAVKLDEPEPPWPTHGSHWRAIVTYAPTVSSPWQVWDILKKAPELAGPSHPQAKHYEMAKAMVLHAPPPKGQPKGKG